jgi:hypothetical protein
LARDSAWRRHADSTYNLIGEVKFAACHLIVYVGELSDQSATLAVIHKKLCLPGAVVVYEIGSVCDMGNVSVIHKLQGVHLPWSL